MEIHDDGLQTRCVTHGSDLAKGTLLVGKIDNLNGELFNIGSEEQVSINEMIEIIEGIADYKVKKNYQLDKPKGVTSFKTPVIPPIIANLPILVNCWTAEFPPITTESSIVT